jgi:hypothetical protein
MTSVHRRKSSKEEDEDLVIAPNGLPRTDGSLMVEGKESQDDLPLRSRVVSSPSGSGPSAPPLPTLHPSQPPSTGPLRTGLRLPQTKGYVHSASSLRPTLSTPTHLHLHGGTHSRTRSVSSGPFTPTSPSPLSMSFPSQHIPSSTTNGRINSHSQPSLNGAEPPPSPSASSHPRRHSRLHSRNLSIFFPQPGSLPHSTIAEDGTQELEIAPCSEDSSPAGVPMPSASPTISRSMQKFGEGFTFGARPPSGVNGGPQMNGQPSLPRTSRRGHHHKHSLSHNFFSFLEPGSMGLGPQTPQVTSSFPQSASPSTVPFPHQLSDSPSPISPLSDSSTSPFSHLHNDSLPLGATVASLWQFALGALLWITGQGIGSLACTGLGYWVVFDAIGVALSTVLPVYLLRPILNGPMRRPFGCAPFPYNVMTCDEITFSLGLADWKQLRCLHKSFT